MQIILEIPDEFVPSIEQYRTAKFQMKFKPGELTPIKDYAHDSVEDVVAYLLGQALQSIAKQFPSPAVTAKLAAIKIMEDEVAALTRPVVKKEGKK